MRGRAGAVATAVALTAPIGTGESGTTEKRQPPQPIHDLEVINVEIQCEDLNVGCWGDFNLERR